MPQIQGLRPEQVRISLPSSARTKLTEAGDALRGDDSDIEAAHEASEAGDAANALLSPYEASEVDEAEAEDALFQGDSNIEAAHEASEAGDAANALLSLYEASEVDEAEAEDALFQDDSDIEAAHEASEAGDAANALLSLYEASEVDKAEAEDALFRDDSDNEATYEAVDIDVDIDIDMDRTEAYDSGEDTNSHNSYIEVDNEAAEDEGALYEALEPGPEAQLQQELRQSQDAELNLPLQLGLHLLNSFSCGGHADSDEQHQDAQEEEENHWSLEDLNRATQRLPDILGSPSILPHDSEHRQRSYDWAQLFEGGSHEQHSSANESSSDSDSDSDPNSERHDDEPPATVCLACSEQPARTNEVQYDIDSIVGFAQSLAFAQKGLYLNFAPQFHQNLCTNVHLTLPVIDHSSGRARTKHVPLSKVPHIRLGRVVGAKGISVYIFFPAQWNPEKPTNFPGKLGGRSYGVLEQWTDRILLPSLASCISSDVAQHLPPSLVLALLRARARNHAQQARSSRQDFLH